MLLLSRYEISGHSMVPSLLPGDEILVSSLPYVFAKPKPRDIVLLKEPKSDKHAIKRIRKIEGDKLFVRGDNNADSFDSRQYGWITKDVVLGKMLLKL